MNSPYLKNMLLFWTKLTVAKKYTILTWDRKDKIICCPEIIKKNIVHVILAWQAIKFVYFHGNEGSNTLYLLQFFSTYANILIYLPYLFKFPKEIISHV
jgi:hypothetical protein